MSDLSPAKTKGITYQGSGDRIVLVSEAFSINILVATLSSFTETQIKTAISIVAGATMDDLHIHRNRDNTIALAIGSRPTTWPEDEPKE